MALFAAAVVSGIATGFLLSLLGFGIVLLYKATGVANFAQGTLATLGAFLAYKMGLAAGLPVWPAALLAILAMLLLGALFYVLIILPKDRSGRLNLTIRTLGLQMLVISIVEHFWSVGQPFPFPPVFPTGIALSLGDVAISWAAVGVVGIAAVLALSFAVLFRFTDVGLTFMGLSERPEILRMLGIPTRRLTLIAWMLVSAIAAVVGILLAPSALLSSDMMEPYMLLAFTAVVLGGLTSLPGVFLGGVVVGIVNNVVALYGSGDLAVFVVFLLLLTILSFRPQGLFGRPEIERL